MSFVVIPRFGGGPVNGCDHLEFEIKHVVFFNKTSILSVLEQQAREKSAERNKNKNGKIRTTGKNTVFIIFENTDYSFEAETDQDKEYCLMKFCHQTFYCQLKNGRDRNKVDSWTCTPCGYYKARHIWHGTQHYNDAYECDCNNNHTKKTSKLRYLIYTNLFIAQFIRSVFFIPVNRPTICKTWAAKI